MEYSGAKILMESLIEQGVDTVFGYPGGSVLYIYDELFKYKDKIRHVLTSHEQHAAHAADGYARATGKVGVCLATSGPGATNLVTGIATAYMDSVPLVAITGNVPTALLGKDSFQEVDITGITMPVVKHNWIVKNVEDLAGIIRDAFIIASSGRKGPVLIDIPSDVSSAKIEWVSAKNRTNKEPFFSPDDAKAARAQRLISRSKRMTFTDSDISLAVRLLSEAKKPLLYAGGGVISSNACEELKLLAEHLNAPVSLSLMAMGAISFDHPLCSGMIGMHGTVASNKAVQQADLVVAIGSRFSNRVTSQTDLFAPNAKVIHFDIDPAEINKNIKVSCGIMGDIKEILRRILKCLPSSLHTEWNSHIATWKKEVPKENYRKETPLHPRFIMKTTAEVVGEDAIISTDVGQHQMWTAQFYPFTKPKTFLTSGGLGTMGFGLGAALGAKIASPEKPVVLFTGDGSFRMNCAELATIGNYHLPILIIVLNNRVLGMVRQWQTLFYDERYAETVLDGAPDFVKLAEAYGISGFKATDKESFSKVLALAMESISKGKAALIEAIIGIDERVLPMVPGGKALDEQIL